MVASRDNFPLLAELLADQQRLDTPVARFARAHDRAAPAIAFAPQLLPLTRPGPGEQYAFEVELSACSGCKSCVAACHALNGLDEDETWRDVGLLVSESPSQPFAQTVTSACHHCADPACLNGCPVLAYEKDPVTGIVRHLDDQCIGCSYCVLKCPYDVPKFSQRLGIVRKCDLCHGRLAQGEAPACAQACPTHAIRVVTVARPSLDTPPPPFLPGAPDPAYTRPTTRYVARQPLPEGLVAADASQPRTQPPHTPLGVMLTLMPAAVGMSLLAAFTSDVSAEAGLAPARELLAGGEVSFPGRAALGAWLVGIVGLGASVFHLGQPRRAWRIALGWRRSWLSREAMLFGAWFGAATAGLFVPAAQVAAGVLGLAGLVCSAMIYVDTRRSFWRASQTFPRFFGTGAVLTAALVAPLAAAGLAMAKMAWEMRTYHGRSAAARLQRGPLRGLGSARDLAGITGILLLVAAPGVAAWLLLLVGELLERRIFFRAVDAPRMPGQPQ